MTSVKNNPVGGGPIVLSEIETTAPVKDTTPQAPTAPLDQVSSEAAITQTGSASATPPPASQSTGLQMVAELRDDANFGVRPNAAPGLDLVDPGFQFDPRLLEMDLGAWFADEIKAHPDGEKAQQMRVLLEGFPDGLAALDPALLGGLG